MLGETLFQYLLEKSLDSAGRFLKERKLLLRSTAKELEDAISIHTKQILEWADEIRFKDISKAKKISQIFIDVDILLMPRKTKISNTEKIEQISSKLFFN